MYKSHLVYGKGTHADAILDGVIVAQIWQVSASEETNGLSGILVCMKAPLSEDDSETYSLERGKPFYDLGEFIPTPLGE